MIKNKLVLFLAVFGSSFVPAFAQTWQNEPASEAPEEEVVIIKERENELPPANRQFKKVPPQEVSKGQDDLKYQFNDYRLNLRPVDPTVRVLTIKPEEPAPYYQRYIKAGIGNYFSPLLEVRLNSPRSPSYVYGLKFRHESAATGPVDKGNSSFSQNELGADASFIRDKFTINSDFFYKRDRFNYYGYNEELLEPEKEDIKQVYNRAGIKLWATNNYKEKTALEVGLGFKRASNFYDANENQFVADFNGKTKISDILQVGITSELLLSRYAAAEDSELNRNLFKFEPAFIFAYEPVEIYAALNAVYENDTAANANKMHVYPRVEVSLEPVENFKAYVGIRGDILPVTYDYLTNENPFLAPNNVPVLFSNKTFDFYGGIKGRITDGVGANVGFSAASVRNMYYFVNSIQDSTQFDVLYDNGNSAVVNIFGELNLVNKNNFQTNLRADYFYYNPEKLEHPWHKPSFKLDWLATYNLYDKIILGANVYVLSGIKAREIGTINQTVDLDPIVNLSLEGTYKFSNQASAFLSFNNLLTKNFERYLNYPSRGIIVRIGGSYTF